MLLGRRPCGCSMAGSVDSPPSCDAATGVCRCKANVEGRQCDRCRPGFFNLQRDNEFGCTPCFCFGHSAVCQSAPGYSKHTVYSTFTRGMEALCIPNGATPLSHLSMMAKMRLQLMCLASFTARTSTVVLKWQQIISWEPVHHAV